MYTEWRRKMRSGLKHFQDSYLPLYEQTTHFRAYETFFVPDLLATASYTAAVLQRWAELMELPADVDAAVAARMQRQNVLYTRGRLFDVLLEEQVLRTQVGDTEVMARPARQADGHDISASRPHGHHRGEGSAYDWNPQQLLDLRQLASAG